MKVPRRMILLGFACFGLMCLSIVIGSAAVVLSQRSIDRNRQAIRVSCTLITNVLAESGATGRTIKNRPKPAQVALNELYIQALRRHLTPVEKQKEAQLLAIAAKRGGIITLPNCSEITKHPEEVQDLAAQLVRSTK